MEILIMGLDQARVYGSPLKQLHSLTCIKDNTKMIKKTGLENINGLMDQSMKDSSKTT